jgi:hypothetical protein
VEVKIIAQAMIKQIMRVINVPKRKARHLRGAAREPSV